MRILRVITRLNIGGPSIQALALTSRLANRGATTTLIHGRLGDGEGDMRYLAAPEASLQFVPTLQRPIAPIDDLRTLQALYRAMRAFKPTLVHTHMAKAGLLGRLAATAYNLTRGDAPRALVVHTYHGHVLEGYFSRPKTAMFIGLERLMAWLSDAIIAISPAIQADLLGTYHIGRPEQYRVVPLGFELGAFAAVDTAARQRARADLKIPADAPVLATVGRLTAIKNYSLLLEAAQLVADTRPGLVVLLAGDGELRGDLEAQAARLGIAVNVRFLGWRRDLPAIYAATDVFALTSRNEGTPVALIEAMATGVPGVSTDVGGVGDVIASSSMGIKVPLDDPRALAAAVERLFADPEQRRRMGDAARAHVLARYDITRLTNDIDTLYQQLHAGRA
ncbi:MAG: glycosyltransferase [Acidobacteriota bacterium]|nr:glycosyltransferase [Acidobacteriota bacterium]MDP2391075.1 glycosyltransferase [Acidobacteriota bacterium]